MQSRILKNKSKKIYLRLKDNGLGFEVAKASEGIGLKSIKSRIKSYGGDLKISSTPGFGTEFKIELPELLPFI